MSEINLVELIGTTGFPIAVTVWLLYERYKSRQAKDQLIADALKNLEIAITELKGLIGKLCDKLNA